MFAAYAQLKRARNGGGLEPRLYNSHVSSSARPAAGGVKPNAPLRAPAQSYLCARARASHAFIIGAGVDDGSVRESGSG